VRSTGESLTERHDNSCGVSRRSKHPRPEHFLTARAVGNFRPKQKRTERSAVRLARSEGRAKSPSPFCPLFTAFCR
jgi:hypothetical protein